MPANRRVPVSIADKVALRRRYFDNPDYVPSHQQLIDWFETQTGRQLSQSIVSRTVSDAYKHLDNPDAAIAAIASQKKRVRAKGGVNPRDSATANDLHGVSATAGGVHPRAHATASNRAATSIAAAPERDNNPSSSSAAAENVHLYLQPIFMPGNKEFSPRAQNLINATKVDYRRLGQSGLRVSVPILGTMGYGDAEGNPMPWVLPEEKVST
jgi:hypothetical protein